MVQNDLIRRLSGFFLFSIGKWCVDSICIALNKLPSVGLIARDTKFGSWTIYLIGFRLCEGTPPGDHADGSSMDHGPVRQLDVARYPFCSRFYASIIAKLKRTVEKLK